MTSLQLPSSLVSVSWLQQHLGHPQLLLFDASWHMPATGRDAFAEWQQERIGGARFFDFDGRICDLQSSLPHMLPDADSFTRELQLLGLNQDSCVVVYDSMGLFSSPRGWWMLRVMGCANVALLDGGLPAWKAQCLATESGVDQSAYPTGDFSARLDAERVADAARVLAALDDESLCVLDVRPELRFSGAADEPRAGLRRGHMPGAKNLPFAQLFDQGLFRSEVELALLLEPLLDKSRAAICSCGSGVTACILAFALHRIGFEQVAVYDGSWCEWGLPGELPVVVAGSIEQGD
jgi:thiosulfate/3-mercaptopyruvate sulfurtransferase